MTSPAYNYQGDKQPKTNHNNTANRFFEGGSSSSSSTYLGVLSLDGQLVDVVVAGLFLDGARDAALAAVLYRDGEGDRHPSDHAVHHRLTGLTRHPCRGQQVRGQRSFMCDC